MGASGPSVSGDCDVEATVSGDTAGTNVFEHLTHQRHVEDAGDVVQPVLAGRKQRGHKVLEHGILRSAYGHLTDERRAAGDDELFHDCHRSETESTPRVQATTLRVGEDP